MDDTQLRFVHISDTHIGPSKEFELFGIQTYPCARTMVESINALPVRPDFVMHTGDIVAGPDPASYGLAAEIFGALHPPIYFVTGNHDRSEEIRRFLPSGPKKDLSADKHVLSYEFLAKGFRCVTLDARGPDEIDPHGVLPQSQLDLVRKIAQPSGPPLVIFEHFPPLPLDSLWFDRDMLLLNGGEFHRLLLPARSRLRGVFLGHVHRGMQVIADGIVYSAVPSAFCQFNAWPEDVEPRFDILHPPSFNFVTMTQSHTIIKEYSVPRPSPIDFKGMSW